MLQILTPMHGFKRMDYNKIKFLYQASTNGYKEAKVYHHFYLSKLYGCKHTTNCCIGW